VLSSGSIAGDPCSLGTDSQGRPASPSASPHMLCVGSGVGFRLPLLIRMVGRGDSCMAGGYTGGGHSLVVSSSCYLSSGGECHSNRRNRRSSVGRHGRWRGAVLQRTVGVRVLVAGHSIHKWWWRWRGCPSGYCARLSWEVRGRLARHW